MRPDMTWRTGPDGRLIEVSASWLDFIGRSITELVDAWLDVIHPEDRDRIVIEWSRRVARPRPYFIAYRVLTAHGKYETVRTWAKPTPDGGFVGVNYVSQKRELPEKPRAVKVIKHAPRIARAQVG